MKILYRRTHTARPEDYESVVLTAQVEIDDANEADAGFFEGDRSYKAIGQDLSEAVDDLLDTDVQRTLKLDGQHIDTTHLWVFYGFEENE